jgi:hypothetical protein
MFVYHILVAVPALATDSMPAMGSLPLPQQGLRRAFNGGLIDKVLLFSRALDEAEIASIPVPAARGVDDRPLRVGEENWCRHRGKIS